MKKRVRTKWQRTPKSIRECVEIQERTISEQVAQIQQLKADGRNLLVQRDEAQRALELLAGVPKIDVVITPPGNRLTRYYAIANSEAIPVFGVMPGDKILIARKKIL